MTNFLKFFLFNIFILFLHSVSAQTVTHRIEILNTDSLKFDKARGADLKLLYGHVSFRQDNVIMNCDSARFYSEANLFDAYSNIHILQGDSIDVWGDSLKYDGNIKLAQLRGKVKMRDKKMILTTQNFDYDLRNNVGQYFNGGKIIDENNVLTSKIGKYLAKSKELFFKDQVNLVNKDYKIITDTLRYLTTTHTAYFLGPTYVLSENSKLYSERGWYNTKTDIAQVEKKSYYVNKEKWLSGDSIYFDKRKGFGRAYRNVVIRDTTKHLAIKGNYAYYKEKPEYYLVTGKAVMEKEFNKDTLFLHADTLVGFMQDTAKKARIIKAYHKVRFFKSDIQGLCDSLVYLAKDSLIEMHQKPVIWSEKSQITGKEVKIQLKGSEIDKVLINNAAFLVSQDIDTIQFNQVKGANMIAYFKNGSFYKLDVNKNGETLYFMKDGDALSGINKAICDNLVVYFKNEEVDEVVFKKDPTGTMFPAKQLHEIDLRLQDFKWLDAFRPVDRSDIFKWKVIP